MRNWFLKAILFLIAVSILLIINELFPVVLGYNTVIPDNISIPILVSMPILLLIVAVIKIFSIIRHSENKTFWVYLLGSLFLFGALYTSYVYLLVHSSGTSDAVPTYSQ